MKKKPALRTRIYRGTPAVLSRLARVLQRGELVAVPTETVYGLAANALDARACQEIFSAKGRPTTDPLIVHLYSVRGLDQVAEANVAAMKLAAAFWPGALTMVLPRRPIIPDIVSAGLPSVAVRVPSHPLFRRLLKLTGLPLAAPSANKFGYVSPTTAAHVKAGLTGKIRYILDGGPAQIGLESTIVDLRDPAHPLLLRPGAITRAELERVLGCQVRAKSKVNAPQGGAQLAPGMLKCHYSPRTPVVLHPRITTPMVASSAPNEAWLLFRRPLNRVVEAPNVCWLDPRGDLPRAGRRLFSMLRELDAGGFKKIHVELARGTGLADAINDRLRRAAAREK